jgi:hypothetical protein
MKLRPFFYLMEKWMKADLLGLPKLSNFHKKGMHHLYFQSLMNLTGLSPIYKDKQIRDLLSFFFPLFTNKQ